MAKFVFQSLSKSWVRCGRGFETSDDVLLQPALIVKTSPCTQIIGNPEELLTFLALHLGITQNFTEISKRQNHRTLRCIWRCSWHLPSLNRWVSCFHGFSTLDKSTYIYIYSRLRGSPSCRWKNYRLTKNILATPSRSCCPARIEV